MSGAACVASGSSAQSDSQASPTGGPAGLGAFLQARADRAMCVTSLIEVLLLSWPSGAREWRARTASEYLISTATEIAQACAQALDERVDAEPRIRGVMCRMYAVCALLDTISDCLFCELRKGSTDGPLSDRANWLLLHVDDVARALAHELQDLADECEINEGQVQTPGHAATGAAIEAAGGLQ